MKRWRFRTKKVKLLGLHRRKASVRKVEIGGALTAFREANVGLSSERGGSLFGETIRRRGVAITHHAGGEDTSPRITQNAENPVLKRWKS